VGCAREDKLRILGINAYHGDSSACLVQDGLLIAAAEEERFRRIKHWAGFPSLAIEFCLKEAQITINDIDFIAINSDPQANLLRKTGYVLMNNPNISFIKDRLKNSQKRYDILQELKEHFPGGQFRGEVVRVEHHMAHLCSSFLVSSFPKAVNVSIDGFGDFSSCAVGVGEGHSIDINWRVYFPHSLGIFYQALTQYLGFLHYGDEYKVMGLAPYGECAYLEKLNDVIVLKDDGTFVLNLNYFSYHKKGVSYQWEGGIPEVGILFTEKLEELLGKRRKQDEPLEQKHKDIARSVQAMYEKVFFHILNKAYQRDPMENLTLSGGCAMNSVANGKVYQNTPFKKMYIQSAAGDAGGAIGSAFYVWSQKNQQRSPFVMDHAYWGTSYKESELEKVIEENKKELISQNCAIIKVSNDEELYRLTATEISKGKVIGWFQGKMEWGPRALGNRSILGDPRRKDMKDILNQKIKRRESFRPFAPSILREAVPEWFETDDDVPFMMAVFAIRPEKRPLIPAVTHVDGSGRLQTVTQKTNERYYRLIEHFNQLTGVPLVLNTSFNENEPVVCQPQEALSCFIRTKMDVLVLGNTIIQRNDPLL